MDEIKGDLLQCGENMAHCVSEDFAMGLGIAKTITRKYGRDDLVKASLHGIGYKKIEDKYILYMVTKSKYWQKPSLSDMSCTLANLRIFCEEREIQHVCMPKIGCGLDKLKWSDVKRLIDEHLIKNNIGVTIYYL